MATSITGSLGQTNNYSALNELIAKWPTAAQNQGIQLSGIAFDGVETDYLNPNVISNLTLASNENPKSWLSYGTTGGIGVPASYSGWFTDAKKIRAEINHNPNTDQSQALKVKWADNQDITSATIDLSSLSPKTSPGLGDQGNEVGFLQLFNNGAPVSISNFTFTRLNAPIAAKPIAVSPDGVTFIGDRTDGSFQFKIDANPLGGATFDELRFSTKAYDSPTAAYVATPFKDDGSDYLVRNIEYQGTEDPITLEFSAPTFSVNEDGTTVAAVTVTRTGSTTGAASATVELSDGTAIAPDDYTNTPLTVNFAAGDAAPQTITIPIANDTLVEGTETLNLTLTNPNGATIGTQGTATLDIADDDSSLEFSAPTFSVNEDGTTVAAVTVTRTGSTTGAASATVELSDGTAIAPDDYTNTPLTVNFAAGDAAPQTITIPIANDTLVEGTETLNLTLTNPNGATIGTQGTATLDIADDDSSLEFSAPTFSVNEDGTTVAAVTVTRTGSTTGAASATVELSDGTAVAPGDYTNTPLTVNFAAGDAAPQTITIPIVNDTLVEDTETLNLTLTNPNGATIGTQGTATLDIVDNDSTLQFSAPTFRVNENGRIVSAVTVTRTGSTTGAVSATVELSDGTAVAPGDYDNQAIVVNFAAGDAASKIVDIPIVNDTLVEGTERVNLSLTNPTGNASIGTQGTAILNIADNDSSLQFSSPTFSVNEDGTPIAAVTVTRIGSAIGAVSATVNLTDGTAVAPGDYTITPLTVNFAAGDTAPKIVTIPIANDTLVEGIETLNLSLTNPTGNATIGTQSTANLDIVDNDSSLQFSAPTFRVNENGRIVSAVTVTRTGSTTGAVSATVNLSNLTAVAADDYDNAPILVNFADGDAAPKIVDIPIVNDTLVEGTERVNLSLINPTGNATIGTQSNAILNIADDDSTLQFSAAFFSVNEGTRNAAVTVTRIGSATGAVSATVNLSDGTAVAPDDYINISPIAVNFASGDSTAKTITIPIQENSLPESNETVNLSLAIATGNATIGTQSTAILNIVDNDVAPAVMTNLTSSSMTPDLLTGFRSASAIGDSGLQDSSLLGGSGPGTVDMSNFITNSFDGAAIANPTMTVNATQNWFPSPTAPIVGGTDPNLIAGVGPSFVASNPFASSVL
ncbi:Calx-beta domain-containing protein [Microcoleus sp. Z1_C4]|uniref:Calx-beta domain-containing protein n=1 Tax=Microcoleus sp. Z1_C4 TaxID=3055432 RepID=UPI002FD63976